MPYTVEGKNLMLDALAAAATHVGLHTAVPSTGSPNEVSGGSPAYARKANTWNSAAAGELEQGTQPVLDVPGGTTVTHVGYWTASSGGTLLAYDDVVPEAFGAQGTYTVTTAALDVNA